MLTVKKKVFSDTDSLEQVPLSDMAERLAQFNSLHFYSMIQITLFTRGLELPF